jgi:hypothetical protein
MLSKHGTSLSSENAVVSGIDGTDTQGLTFVALSTAFTITEK